MNIKHYIDRFDEIAHLPRDQQFDLLEQARFEIESNTPWPSFSVISSLLRFGLVLLLTASSYMIWGLSNWLLLASVIVALLLSRVAITEINDNLMLKGLKRILQKEPNNPA